MKDAIILIDTSDQKITYISLQIDGKRYESKSDSVQFKSQMTLPLIEKLLNEHHVDIGMISEIRVFEGPGSFTGLRVGIAIANALSFILSVPVNGKYMLANAKY